MWLQLRTKILQVRITLLLVLVILSLCPAFAKDVTHPPVPPVSLEKRLDSYTKLLSVEKLHSLAMEALQVAYPSFHPRLEGGRLNLSNGTSILFDDSVSAPPAYLLETPDIFDMFFYRYPSRQYRTGVADQTVQASTSKVGSLSLPAHIPFPEDPGRVRNDQFFKAMYGATAKEVRQRLVAVKWLPSAKGPTLWVTSVNGVDKALASVSKEFDQCPELWPYLLHSVDTFNWRVIAGTKRLSFHAFGAALDINVAQSHYWRDKVKEETMPVPYKNTTPAKIVEIFEKYGFIWGGWWYHFDTMHFEYRPELIAYMNLVEDEIGKQAISQ